MAAVTPCQTRSEVEAVLLVRTVSSGGGEQAAVTPCQTRSEVGVVLLVRTGLWWRAGSSHSMPDQV